MRNVRIVGFILLSMLLVGCANNTSSNGYNTQFDTQNAAKTRMSLGLTYLQNGNYTQAKKNLDQAFEYAPQSADVNYALAYYYQVVGEKPRAHEYYQTALKFAPENGDIANSYGAFLCQTDDYDGAKRYFLKAVSIRNYANSAETYENLALCAQTQGFIDDAIQYLTSALQHQPTRRKSLYLITELYIMTEQWDKAQTNLALYDRVAPVSPDALWMAFDIARGQSDWERARQLGEALVNTFPQSPLAQRYTELASGLSVLQVQNTDTDVPSQADSTPLRQISELTQDSPRFHIVKAGENLYRISLMHNIKLATLQTWNQLDDASAIVMGKKLWLVPPEMQQ